MGSCVLTSLVTAAVVLYIDVKPGTNTFAEAGDVICRIDTEDLNGAVITVPAAAVTEDESLPSEIDACDTVSSDFADDSDLKISENENNGINEIIISDAVYYKLSGRDKYHVNGCQYIRGKDNVESVTDLQISEQNLVPCKKCIE